MWVQCYWRHTHTSTYILQQKSQIFIISQSCYFVVHGTHENVVIHSDFVFSNTMEKHQANRGIVWMIWEKTNAMNNKHTEWNNADTKSSITYLFTSSNPSLLVKKKKGGGRGVGVVLKLKVYFSISSKLISSHSSKIVSEFVELCQIWKQRPEQCGMNGTVFIPNNLDMASLCTLTPNAQHLTWSLLHCHDFGPQ